MSLKIKPIVISLEDAIDAPHPADAPLVIDKGDENSSVGNRRKLPAPIGYAKYLGGLFLALCSFYITLKCSIFLRRRRAKSSEPINPAMAKPKIKRIKEKPTPSTRLRSSRLWAKPQKPRPM